MNMNKGLLKMRKLLVYGVALMSLLALAGCNSESKDSADEDNKEIAEENDTKRKRNEDRDIELNLDFKNKKDNEVEESEKEKSDDSDSETEKETEAEAETTEAKEEATAAKEEKVIDANVKTEGKIPLAPPVFTNVTASSQLADEYAYGEVYNYSPNKVWDGSTSTCWAEGVSDSGIGETLTLTADSEGFVKRIKIYNGYCSKSETYYKNNRVKEMAIYFSDGSKTVVTLNGDYDAQPNVIELPNSVVTDSITFEILNVHEGNTFNDTCISEISVD